MLTLKLNTDGAEAEELRKRFLIASRMRNRLVSHAKKCLRSVRQDTDYRVLMKEYLSARDRRDKLKENGGSARETAEAKRKLARVGKELAVIREAHGLSEYAFHSWISVQKRKYPGRTDIHSSQKLASSVWRGVEDVLFKKGKTLHFRACDRLMSVEGKSNSAGIRFRSGRVEWLGLSLAVKVRKNDAYAREALTRRVKFCRLLRKPVGTEYHWYVQLVLEGRPPKKHAFLPDGRVGIDQGTSTEAVVSERGCLLTELCPERPDISRKIRVLQRKMDRSARAMNPGNFRENGTPKRHVRWTRSKTWRRDRMRLKALYRKAADAARCSRERLADTVLEKYGSDIVTEEMDYKALQKRTKKTEISGKTGRPKRKKRFGASIGRHAPAAFISVLERKLSYIGKAVTFVNTKEYRASCFRHDTGEYEKHSLSDREKTIDGCPVQRDLYSAFLLMCAESADRPDTELCRDLFPSFVTNQNTEILRLLN